MEFSESSYEFKDLQEISDNQIKTLQEKSFEILLHFKAFCDKYNLTFTLAGGSLIGTMRHKGFIPWDDDIDVFMLRKDYEKFKILWEKYGDKENYTYCRTNKNENYHNGSASLRDNNTTFINKHSVDEDICHGLGIDIIPLDGHPNSKLKRAYQLTNAYIYNLFNVQRLPDNKGGFARVGAKIIYSLVPSKKIRYKIWKKAEKNMTKYDYDKTRYVTELIGSFKGMMIRHPLERFSTSVYKIFEGHKMPIMKGHEEYLEIIFGDYMELPPLDKRKAKHNIVYANLKEPYTKYKGIYYCQDEKGKI